MIDQLLELELGLIKARLDARKVLPKKSGKRPGKFCKGKSGKGSYIAAEKKCADHETTTPDGKRKLSESGKRSAEELAKKVRERKGMKRREGGKEIPLSDRDKVFGSIFDVVPNRPGSIELHSIVDEGDHYKVSYTQLKERYTEKVSKQSANESLAKIEKIREGMRTLVRLPKVEMAKNGKPYLELDPGSHKVGDTVDVNHGGKKVSAKIASTGKPFERGQYATATNFRAGSSPYDEGDFVKVGSAQAQRFYIILPLIKKARS